MHNLVPKLRLKRALEERRMPPVAGRPGPSTWRITHGEPTTKSRTSPAAAVKMWTRGVPVEDEAQAPAANAARLPFVFKHIAAMPDVHFGIGATVGSVIPTKGAIIPAAVGVDIGCGMMAVQTTLTARGPAGQPGAAASAIERAVPHGSRTKGARDRAPGQDAPDSVDTRWARSSRGCDADRREAPEAGEDARTAAAPGHARRRQPLHRGLPRRSRRVWVMLHSGSRGVGNAIGSYFIELAREGACATHFINLPDHDLAYFEEGTSTSATTSRRWAGRRSSRPRTAR